MQTNIKISDNKQRLTTIKCTWNSKERLRETEWMSKGFCKKTNEMSIQINQLRMTTTSIIKVIKIWVMFIPHFRIETRIKIKECANLQRAVYQWQSQLLWLRMTEVEAVQSPNTLSWTRNHLKETGCHWEKEMIKAGKEVIDKLLIKSIIHPMDFMVVELISKLFIIGKFQKNLTILSQQ